MKRMLQLGVALALLVGVAPVERVEAQAAATGPTPSIGVKLDGWRLPVSPEPFLYKGRTMMPFRSLADALGIAVNWEAETSTVVATADQLDIRLQVNNRTARVNGQEVALDAEPVIVDGRTMIPLRFFSEAIGARVGWEPETMNVTITSQQRDLETMVFYGLGSYSKRSYLPAFDQAAFTWSILDADGQLATDQTEYQWPAAGADELLADVREQQVGTNVMVFSANVDGEISTLIRDEALQEKFLDDLVAKLEAKQLAGAVFDLESLQSEDKALYSTFVERAATALHRAGKTLTVVVHPLNGWFSGYDYQALGAAADRLLVMAYSYTKEELVQPLDQVDEAIHLSLRHVDKSKLLLGINAYSETPASVQEKLGLAKRYGLAGAAFWILVSFDDPFMAALDQSLLLANE